MKVLIVGGGIGGLSLAANLKKRGIKPVIAEKCKEWKTIGYILGLFPLGTRMLKEIGATEVIKKSAVIPGHILKDPKDNVILEKSFDEYERKYGPTIECEREELHKALRDVNKDTDIRMNTTIQTLEEEEKGVKVTFNNGDAENFDIVVGADGIDSQIRSMIHPEAKKDYSGSTFWFMWIPKVTKIDNAINYIGQGKFVGLYPCKNKEKMCVLFMVPAKEHSFSDPDVSISFIREHFKDMKGYVPEVLKNLPDEPAKIFHHDDDEVHLKDWYKGRIVLLGDSIHALSPIFGLGAAMALEDSHVLAEELSRCDNYKSAFENYYRRRFPRVSWIANTSKEVHFMFRLSEPPFTKRLVNTFLTVLSKKMMPKYYEKLEDFLGADI